MFDPKPVDVLDQSIAGRRAWLIAGLLLVLHALLCWHGRELGILLMRDDARYLILARSIAAGGYHDIYLIGSPAHSLYPPGFPVILLTWGSIVADSFDSYVLMNVIFSTSTLLLVFAAVKRVWGPFIGLACLLPLTLNPFLIMRAGGLRSETAYMFFSIVALWALSRARPATVTLVVAALAALLAALTRSIGVTLLAAIGLLWLSQRRYKATTVLAIASLLTIGVWIAWTFMAPQQLPGTNYIGDLVGGTAGERPDALTVLWKRTGVRLWRYFGRSIPWALPMPTIPGTPIDNLVGIPVAAASLVAGTVVLWKRWRIAGAYIILYGGALMAWPFMRTRFIEPILPLLVPALLLGAAALVGSYRPKWAPGVIVVLSLFVTASAIGRSGKHVARQMSCEPFDMERPPFCLTPQQRTFLQAAHYIAERVPADEVVMSAMPEPLYYYTGRRSLLGETAMLVSPPTYLDYLDEEGVAWVLLTAGAPRLAEQLRPHCGRVRLERKFWVRTVLFEVPPPNVRASLDPPSVERLDACVAIDEYLEQHPAYADNLDDE
jgi:hypothetical protein